MNAPSYLLYGPTGSGKTTACLQAFNPAVSYWIECEPGGLAVAASPDLNPWYPAAPQRVGMYDEVFDYDSPSLPMREATNRAIEAVRAGRAAVVVIDGGSTFARRDRDQHMGTVRVKDEYGEAAQLAGRHLQEFIDRLQATGAVVVMTCQEKLPSALAHARGGPKLPGRMIEDVPSMFDTVLRCGVEKGSAKAGVGRYMECENDAAWLTKDRWDLVHGRVPLDVGSHFRAALARWEGLQA